MRITWDQAKEAANIEKHGVSFSEAQTVLEDVDALYRNDPDSADEDRWIVIGLSQRYRVLTVVTWESRDSGEVRIISARRATRSEKASYEGRR